ncbi:MAG: prepilin peptidase [Rhodocyclales bacterium]|nr:prepilin peptidase [Rhodocyclales bacterium]
MFALLADPVAFAIVAGFLGLLVGSFLNVVIHRLPLMMERDWATQCAELRGETPAPQAPFSLARPRSRCPKCGHSISTLENIPLVSWLLLGGKCRGCGTSISIRYPLIEATTGILFACSAWQFGFGAAAIGAMLLVAAAIVLTGIDFDTQLLPDDVTLPLLWIGLIFNYFNVFTSLHNAVAGAMLGYLALWTVYWAFKLATGKEGMGYGDFKLLGALGAWFGWQMLPLIILLSSLVGAVVGISLMVFARHGRNVPIPFGPYLAAAGLIALFWGKPLTRTFVGVSL